MGTVHHFTTAKNITPQFSGASRTWGAVAELGPKSHFGTLIPVDLGRRPLDVDGHLLFG